MTVTINHSRSSNYTHTTAVAIILAADVVSVLAVAVVGNTPFCSCYL